MKKLLCPLCRLGCALLVAVLALAACGGSGTTASTSPSASPSEAASPSVAASPSAIPLPSPTVAGTIAFSRAIEPGANYDIYVVRSDGTGIRQLTNDPGVEEHPSWSPDGKRIAYDAGSQMAPYTSVWVMNANGSGKVKLTKGSGNGYHPHWSPDGKQIVYNRYEEGASGEDVLVMNADGSGARRVIDLKGGGTDPTWASDGRILYTNGGGDVCAVQPDGSGRVRLTKGENVMDSAPSPNGKLLAYHDLDGDHVVVVPLSGAGALVTLLKPVTDFLADDVEAAVTWSPSGKALALASNSGDGLYGSRLFVFDADGSGLSAVPGVDAAIDPAWRPGPKGSADLADLARWTTDVGWGAYSVGRYAFTSPDKSDKIKQGDRIVAHGKWYRHGLFAHAPSELTFELGGAFATFSTTMVMVETISGPGVDGAIFVVELDGAEIYRSKPMLPSSQPRHLKLRVAGGQLLTLITAPLGDNNSDWTIWGDPSLR